MAIRIDRNVEMPMRDGAVLRGDVWRSADDGLPKPAILFRTPYNKDTLSAEMLRPQQCVLSGYAAVVQDTRGRFASGGEWGAIMWEQEGPDTYDTVEWIAEQSWCDGNVGMAGPSYLSIVQMLGAMEEPPHLRAIAPTMTTDAQWEMEETGGAFRLDHVLSWLAFMAGDWLQRRMVAGQPVPPETIGKVMQMALNPRMVMDHLPIKDNPWFELDDFPITLEQILSGEIAPSISYRYEDISVPVLLVGGVFDTFARATIGILGQLQDRGGADPSSHRLIIGPWVHAGVLPPYQGEMNFGILSAGLYSKLPEQHIAFFDQHLKGEGPGLPPVSYHLANSGEWRSAETWPPPHATERVLYLHSSGEAAASATDGRLDAEVPSAQAQDTYLSDPDNPVPTHGGRVLYLGGLVAGPLNQSHLEARPDVLVYTSAPLDAPLDVVGPVRLRLHAATTATDTDFVGKLCDVQPDGRAVLVADGNRRARYRYGFETEQLVEPGKVEVYDVDLGPVAWRFEAGHRLRVHVQSSNFPHLDRNLQTGNPVGADAKGEVATQTIFHDGDHPSQLVLSVIGG